MCTPCPFIAMDSSRNVRLVHDARISTAKSLIPARLPGQRTRANPIHRRACTDSRSLDADGPLTRTAKWLRTLRTGQSHAAPSLPEGELFDQLHHEVTHLARDLMRARNREEEARLRDSNVSLWTAERLRVSLSNNYRTRRFSSSPTRALHACPRQQQRLCPSNRSRSGLSLLWNPCSRHRGTWIAHGSGNATVKAVDARTTSAFLPTAQLHATPCVA